MEKWKSGRVGRWRSRGDLRSDVGGVGRPAPNVRRSGKVEKWKSGKVGRGGSPGDLRSGVGGVGRPAPSAAIFHSCTLALFNFSTFRLFHHALFEAADDFFRRADGDDAAAAVAGFGTQVDDPVGLLDDVQVVLDQDHGVAQVDQAVQDLQQFGQIVEVQARGRLVQQVQRAAGVRAGQLGGQFDPLGFAAGQRRGGLPQRQVIESHVAQGLQDAANLGDVLEQLQRLAAGHVQHVADRLAVVGDRQRFGIVPPAFAGLAFDPDVGQEVHLDALLAVAFAVLATAAGHVEAESPRAVAAQLGFRQLGEQLADQVEHAGVGGGIGCGRVAQRLLVDADHLVDVLDAADLVVRAGNRGGPVQPPGEGFVQDVFDQGTLAAAADAGHGGQGAQGNLNVDVLQVVVAGTADFEPFHRRPVHRRPVHRRPVAPRAGDRVSERRGYVGALPGLPIGRPLQAAVGRDRDGFPAAEVRAGHAAAAAGNLCGLANGDDLAAVLAGAGAEVAEIVAARDHLAVMLDDQQRVAQVT